MKGNSLDLLIYTFFQMHHFIHDCWSLHDDLKENEIIYDFLYLAGLFVFAHYWKITNIKLRYEFTNIGQKTNQNIFFTVFCAKTLGFENWH
jgi:hypothetical protein